MMETVYIPPIERPVSRIALGTWAIGGWMWGGSDDINAIATIQKAVLECGINIIDTAPVYGFGHAETLVGRALSGGLREKVVIATKTSLDWDDDGNVMRNATRKRIFKEVDDSLERLQTDYIDLYQVHWPDPLVSAEETASAMNELLEMGKIRAIGVSNYSVEQIESFRQYAPLHSDQPPFNLFERQAAQEILPFCEKNGLATLTYGILCRGLLSGRMKGDTRFEGDDLRLRDPKFQPPRYVQYLQAVSELSALARSRYGKSVMDLAARWVLDHPGVSVAIWGARRPDQLNAIREVTDWCLDAETKKEIESILERCVRDPVGAEFMAPPLAGC